MLNNGRRIQYKSEVSFIVLGRVSVKPRDNLCQQCAHTPANFAKRRQRLTRILLLHILPKRCPILLCAPKSQSAGLKITQNKYFLKNFFKNHFCPKIFLHDAIIPVSVRKSSI